MSAFSKAEGRIQSMRMEARAAAKVKAASRQRAGWSGYRHGTIAPSPFDNSAIIHDDSNKARRQYEANRDTVHSAIRPLYVKAAGQSFRCGFDGVSDRQKDFMVKGFAALRGRAAESRMAVVPVSVKESGQNITPIDKHLLLTLLNYPNEGMTGYGLKSCSFASMALTGSYVWWIDNTGANREDVPELRNLRLWYLPRSWVRRDNPRQPNQWKIQPPGMASPISVTSSELFISTMHDPGNPMMPFSALQAQAKSVDTEDKVLRAQAISMDNCMRPNMILTVGRTPGMPIGGGRSGPGYRPILTGDQREQIISALRLMYQSVSKYGEPLILDGLIEDAKPFLPSPAELDMVNSSGVLRNRIMEGFGVSPVAAGYTENVNRAGATVAREIMYEFALNPMIEQASQDMDSILGPRFTPPGQPRLRVWMELAVADDPDSALARATAFSDVLTLDEKRQFVASGRLKLDKLSEAEKAKLQESSMRAVASAQPREVVTGE